MKIFRELVFEGTKGQLLDFVKEINSFAVGDWVSESVQKREKDYLQFMYNGVFHEKAKISIYLGESLDEGKIKVGNIVPTVKNSLTVDEYNSLLMQFYEDVIKPYKEQGTLINISPPTDDIFDPLTIISDIALRKLKSFCQLANKTTGSSHPSDRDRWFEFICQTVDDGMIIEYTTLANFLHDEVYWGKKPDGFIGAMGNYAWSEERAYELADEYSNAVEILKYYQKTRGN